MNSHFRKSKDKINSFVENIVLIGFIYSIAFQS